MENDTCLEVESLRLQNVIIDYVDIDPTVLRVRKIFDELLQLWSTDTICTVDSNGALNSSTVHDRLESCGHFLVIAFFGSLTICIFCTSSVDTADHVMELRGCQDTVILVFDAQDVEGRFQSFDQVRAGGASISCEDNLGWAFVDLADLINKRLV